MTKPGIVVSVGWTLAVFLSGCIVVHPNGSGINSDQRELLSSAVVRVPSFTGARVSLSRMTQTTAELSLVCTGEFVQENTFNVKQRPGSCDCLAVGLLPTYLAAVDNSQGGDQYLTVAGVGLLIAPWVNLCLAFIPTIDTMFFEPFKSSYSSRKGLTGWAEAGLVGCYKYRGKRSWFVFDRKEKDYFVQRVYLLSDYSFRIGGRRYDCKAPQEKIVVDIPSETQTEEIVIERVPEFDGEFGRYLKSMVGVPLTVDVK